MTRTSDEVTEFDRHTAVTSLGDGRYRTEVDPGWDVIGGAPNGGYLMAILVRALLEETGAPDPISVTGHFPARTPAGEAEVTTEVVHAGKRLTIARAVLVSDERPRVLLTGVFGDLDEVHGPSGGEAQEPALPPREECVSIPDGMDAPPITDRFDLGIDPSCIGWALGQPSGEAYAGAWLRFADGREPDTLSLVTYADAMFPAVLNAVPEPSWVPTLEMTVHVRDRPSPGWLKTVFTTRHLDDGRLEEDGEIWDSEGRLVALSRQYALVRG